ncbi:unnamed protein product [Rotaria sp. Silwood1]|nr:unnamed protein product [Rotaria sp. Silwood1]CAF1651782.1 unnamed protein product [Rotaria sp. Silwood1]
MAPLWYEYNDPQQALKGIVYPPNAVELRPFNTIACYRMTIGQSNNFRQHPISVSENSTETLILMLDTFAQQFGADLSFTKNDVLFDRSAYRIACGVANLGNVHLLVTNYIATAKFSVMINIDYDKSLAGLDDTIKDFLLNFSERIARKLNFSEEYLRICSVEKLPETPNMMIVHFGFTTPNRKDTEQIARDFQARARVGFGDDTVLQYVKPGEYTYSWVPMLSYLQLNANDFARKNNVDYRKSGLPESERHGGYPYYLPIGWYYHALKLDQKYSDGDVWFGSVNATGEWPVAFHGTHSSTVDGITQKGLVTSVVEADTASSKMMESTMNQPEIYLTTHCNGGAHPHYTKPFHLEIPDKKKNTFRIVFMCRAQPGKFTTHQVSTSTGHTWRFVDPDAVRPYGILIKDEDTLDKS